LLYHAACKARLPSAADDGAEGLAYMTTRATDNTGAPPVRTDETRKSTETKSAYNTTELIVSIVDGFDATETWRYFTYLSVGYMISRGLAKAGSREPYRN
jgi:hypothetical protein